MKHTIALVDDDRNILTSVSMTLEQEGFQVRTYTDGESALQGITSRPVDLAVLDIKMPRMDGMELLQRLRARSQLPVIFLTSKDEEVDQLMGLRLGADDYITKPFSQRLLLERIRALLRRGEALRRLIEFVGLVARVHRQRLQQPCRLAFQRRRRSKFAQVAKHRCAIPQDAHTVLRVCFGTQGIGVAAQSRVVLASLAQQVSQIVVYDAAPGGVGFRHDGQGAPVGCNGAARIERRPGCPGLEQVGGGELVHASRRLGQGYDQSCPAQNVGVSLGIGHAFAHLHENIGYGGRVGAHGP